MKIKVLLLIIICLNSAYALTDRRILIQPESVSDEILKSMRDHLNATQEILNAIIKNDMNTIARVSENRLGFKSLTTTSASHNNMPFIPKVMETLSLGLAQSASELAIYAKNNEKEKLLPALNKVMGYCVSCHNTYRIR
ncbi:hypothetical secreted protein [hydrothermal vent metagenome]|uniref:Hypothetical secreted protein n=1 Tax=hydrothermal vent metagenome TaxID=652676 RepID=A0A1W1BWX0_9ZZZZ